MKFNLCVAVAEEVRGSARTQFKVNVGSNPVRNIGAMTWKGLCEMEMEKVKGGSGVTET